MSASLPEFLRRLRDATNDHDLDCLVDCFGSTYRNETPAHPARGFEGRDQVRANWAQIFAAIPDVTSRVLDWAERGSRVWSEWEMSGTRPDGSAHLMRGVIVFDLQDDRAAAARFYLEPVDESGAGVDQAVRDQVRSDVSR